MTAEIFKRKVLPNQGFGRVEAPKYVFDDGFLIAKARKPPQEASNKFPKAREKTRQEKTGHGEKRGDKARGDRRTDRRQKDTRQEETISKKVRQETTTKTRHDKRRPENKREVVPRSGDATLHSSTS